MYSYQPQFASTAIAVGQMIMGAAENASRIIASGAQTRAQMKMQSAQTSAEILTQGSNMRAQMALDKYKADLAANTQMTLAQMQNRDGGGGHSPRISASPSQPAPPKDKRIANERALELDPRGTAPATPAPTQAQARPHSDYPQSGGREESNASLLFSAYTKNTPKVKSFDDKGTVKEVDNPWYSPYLTDNELKARAKHAKDLDGYDSSPEKKKRLLSIAAVLNDPEKQKAFDGYRNDLSGFVVKKLAAGGVGPRIGLTSVDVVSGVFDGAIRKSTVQISGETAGDLGAATRQAVEAYARDKAIKTAPATIDPADSSAALFGAVSMINAETFLSNASKRRAGLSALVTVPEPVVNQVRTESPAEIDANLRSSTSSMIADFDNEPEPQPAVSQKQIDARQAELYARTPAGIDANLRSSTSSMIADFDNESEAQ